MKSNDVELSRVKIMKCKSGKFGYKNLVSGQTWARLGRVCVSADLVLQHFDKAKPAKSHGILQQQTPQASSMLSNLCTRRLVHQERFTPNSFYTRILWQDGNFYTQNLLTPEASCNIFSQEDLYTKHFYIRKLARQTSLTPETLYTEEPLHKNPETFCSRDSLQQELLHHKTFKAEIVYTKQFCYPNKEHKFC